MHGAEIKKQVKGGGLDQGCIINSILGLDLVERKLDNTLAPLARVPRNIYWG